VVVFLIVPDYMTEEEVKARIKETIITFKKMGAYHCRSCKVGKLVPEYDNISKGVTGYSWKYDCDCNPNVGIGIL